MTLVATLIAGGADQPLMERAIALAGSALRDAGARLSPPDWLSPHEAVDIAFEGLDIEGAQDRLTSALEALPLDHAVQAAAARPRRLLVADLESTIIGQEMLDELADAAGMGPHIKDITARAMAGELDFAASLKERVGLLAGQSESLLDRVAERMSLNPGAVTLIATLRRQGCHTALVSGGFTRFARPIADRCGFDSVVANELLIDQGRLTGTVAEPLLDRDAKLQTLKRRAQELGITVDQTCAIGDGANDAAMLEVAGLGVAYRPKPPARAAANAALDHGDLTAVLYLQGIPRSAFVTP